jgi:alpha-L-fucosidase
VDHAGIPFDTVEQVHAIEKGGRAFTTSTYQDFQLNQITEILTQYGKIAEFWLDEPGVLGRGYRTFLYHHIAGLQPDCVIVCNGSYGDTERWDPWFTWPQDVIGYEISALPERGHARWRTVEGKRYYLPAEVYDLIGQHWFWVEGDKPRPDEILLKLYGATRKGGGNLLLDVPPDYHGLIPDTYRDALMRLRKHARM